MELELATMPFIILTVYLLTWMLKRFILKTDIQKNTAGICCFLRTGAEAFVTEHPGKG